MTAVKKKQPGAQETELFIIYTGSVLCYVNIESLRNYKAPNNITYIFLVALTTAMQVLLGGSSLSESGDFLPRIQALSQ